MKEEGWGTLSLQKGNNWNQSSLASKWFTESSQEESALNTVCGPKGNPAGWACQDRARVSLCSWPVGTVPAQRRESAPAGGAQAAVSTAAGAWGHH